MKSSNVLIFTLILALMIGCGGGGGGSPATKTLVSLALSPINPSIFKGTVQQFTATGTYSDSSTQVLTTSVTWTSSAASVATISNDAGANGRAASVAAGTTTIIAAVVGVSASTTLTVTPATLVSLAVSPTNPSIRLGTTQQFTATGTYSDSSTQVLTTSVAWTSSAASVATISNAAGANGRATSVAAGTTTIIAAVVGVSASTTLTVTPTTLASLAVSPTNPSVSLGSPQQFTATGTYSDNSAQNLTTSVTWTSSAASVATISNAAGANGRAASTAVGTTTITAALGGVSASTALTVTGGAANNVIPITVNGSLCSANSYLNKPCVSVTVCTPGTSTCQTIDDILLDTGSYGLRIFKQALAVLLSQVTSASGSIAECVQFGDGSSMWGPVQTASVILANEPPVQVSIQVVDSTFGTRSAGCSNADPTPAAAGFNGILGMGLFKQDCGTICESNPNKGRYYACSGANCNGTTVPLSSQVQNPAALLPRDNNGVLVQLPSVPPGGTSAVNGSLILGIGTQPNNVPPSSVTAYSANATTGEFTTLFSGRTYNSFIDSGSNGLFFTPPTTIASQLPICAAPNAGWFCPVSTLSLWATNTGASGAPSVDVQFYIGNLEDLILNSSIKVSAEIGGTYPSNFDWGLPFFFGRNVFIGYSGSTSSLGDGPYWAY